MFSGVLLCLLFGFSLIVLLCYLLGEHLLLLRLFACLMLFDCAIALFGLCYVCYICAWIFRVVFD